MRLGRSLPPHPNIVRTLARPRFTPPPPEVSAAVRIAIPLDTMQIIVEHGDITLDDLMTKRIPRGDGAGGSFTEGELFHIAWHD